MNATLALSEQLSHRQNPSAPPEAVASSQTQQHRSAEKEQKENKNSQVETQGMYR